MSTTSTDGNSISGRDAGEDTTGGEVWSRERSKKLDQLLASIERKLSEGDYKASIGDFIRLLHVRKELEDEKPREITITWVEPSGEENAPAR